MINNGNKKITTTNVEVKTTASDPAAKTDAQKSAKVKVQTNVSPASKAICKLIKGEIPPYGKKDIVQFEEPEFSYDPKKPEEGYFRGWFMERCTLFSNKKDGRQYVSVVGNNNAIMTMPLGSKELTEFMAIDLYNTTNHFGSPDKLARYSVFLKGLLKANPNAVNVYSRIGVDKTGNLYYNLANDKGEFVKISPQVARIIHSSMVPEDVYFVNKSTMRPQVKPATEPSAKTLVELLRKYILLENEQLYDLLAIVLVTWFFPNFPKPIILMTGEPGSGKSTSCHWIQEILDPAAHRNFVIMRDVDKMKPIFSSHYVSLLDNVSKLTDDQSDFLATAVTGSSAGARKLYTDDDLVVTNFEFCAIILAGIQNFVVREDLMSRVVHFAIRKPGKNEAKAVEELEADFKADLPFILQQIFLTLVKVLKMRKRYDEIVSKGKNPKIPQFVGRLLDFERTALFVSHALFGNPDVFHAKYAKAMEKQTKELLLRNVTVNCTYEFLENLQLEPGKTYVNTPTGMFQAVHTYGVKLGIISGSMDPSFAQGAAHFGKIVAGADAPNPTFLKLGYKIRSKSGTHRKIVVEKL